MTKDEIKKEIAECEEKLKALREELDKSEYGGKRWKPEEGKPCFILFSDGEISERQNGVYYSNYYTQGNCFKTKEEAEFELERREIITELSDFAEGDEAVWDGRTEHWFICYSFEDQGILYDYYQTWKSNQFYFPSLEAAMTAVGAVGEERVKKYYLGVK